MNGFQRAAAYLRVSSQKQADERTILSQRQDSREVKCNRGTMNPGWETDVGRAAEVGTNRIIGRGGRSCGCSVVGA